MEIGIFIALILTILILLFTRTRQDISKLGEKERLLERRMRQMERSFAAERRVFIENEKRLKGTLHEKEKRLKDMLREKRKIRYKTSPPELSSENTYWHDLSRWLRQEKQWRCEKCGIDLAKRQRDLHVHHIHGRGYNSPQHLKVLCRECHADEPEHEFMKDYPEYKAFLAWKRRLK